MCLCTSDPPDSPRITRLVFVFSGRSHSISSVKQCQMNGLGDQFNRLQGMSKMDVTQSILDLLPSIGLLTSV